MKCTFLTLIPYLWLWPNFVSIASVPNLIGLDSLLYNNVNQVSNSGQTINKILSLSAVVGSEVCWLMKCTFLTLIPYLWLWPNFVSIASVPNLIGLDSLLYNNVNQVSNSGHTINKILSLVCICETRCFRGSHESSWRIGSPLAIYCEELGQGYMSRSRVLHRRGLWQFYWF